MEKASTLGPDYGVYIVLVHEVTRISDHPFFRLNTIILCSIKSCEKHKRLLSKRNEACEEGGLLFWTLFNKLKNFEWIWGGILYEIILLIMSAGIGCRLGNGINQMQAIEFGQPHLRRICWISKKDFRRIRKAGVQLFTYLYSSGKYKRGLVWWLWLPLSLQPSAARVEDIMWYIFMPKILLFAGFLTWWEKLLLRYVAPEW